MFMLLFRTYVFVIKKRYVYQNYLKRVIKLKSKVTSNLIRVKETTHQSVDNIYIFS